MNFKKILSAIGLLTIAVPTTLSVTACGQESLDNNLKIIFNGTTKYDIKELIGKDISKEAMKTFTLTKNETNKLAKSIAETILKKSDPNSSIVWYDETPENNQKCYNFNVKNGEEKQEKITWKVDDQTNQRFTINIRYWVGITNSENKFVAHQQIDKTFTIKVATSNSDNIVDTWIKTFNNQKWNSNPINVDLTKTKVDLPEKGTSWSDLSKELIEKTYTAIRDAVRKFENKESLKPIAWKIQSTKTTITDNMRLELQISGNLNDSIGTTETFYVLFLKNK